MRPRHADDGTAPSRKQRPLGRRIPCALLWALLPNLIGTVSGATSVFPSAPYGLVIPGGHQAQASASTGPEGGGVLVSPDAVKEWEIAHSQTSFGGNFGAADNARLGVFLGYMYAQASSTRLGPGNAAGGQCCRSSRHAAVGRWRAREGCSFTWLSFI